MGARIFRNYGIGATPQEAFENSIKALAATLGSEPYSGTLKEKTRFVLLKCPEGVMPNDFVQNLIDNRDPRIADKFGPAGCIDLGPLDDKKHKYLFFGWAAS